MRRRTNDPQQEFGKREAPERARLAARGPSLLERLRKLVLGLGAGKMKPKTGAARTKPPRS